MLSISRRRERSRARLLALLGILLWGCSTPVPPDKQDYVGTWRGGGMTLVITAEGRVEYERVRGSVKKSLSAPLRSFEDDDLVVGIWGLTTTFRVQRRPHRDGADWKMLVDGVELVRAR